LIRKLDERCTHCQIIVAGHPGELHLTGLCTEVLHHVFWVDADIDVCNIHSAPDFINF
jgi:hypothetical protein